MRHRIGFDRLESRRPLSGGLDLDDWDEDPTVNALQEAFAARVEALVVDGWFADPPPFLPDDFRPNGPCFPPFRMP